MPHRRLFNLMRDGSKFTGTRAGTIDREGVKTFSKENMGYKLITEIKYLLKKD